MGEHPPNMFDSLSTSLTCSSSNEDIPVPVHDPAQVHGAIALLFFICFLLKQIQIIISHIYNMRQLLILLPFYGFYLMFL